MQWNFLLPFAVAVPPDETDSHDKKKAVGVAEPAPVPETGSLSEQIQ
jgi:hypothetical protein